MTSSPPTEHTTNVDPRPIIVKLGKSTVVDDGTNVRQLLDAIASKPVLTTTLEPVVFEAFFDTKKPANQVAIHDHVPFMTRTELVSHLQDNTWLVTVLVRVLREAVGEKLGEYTIPGDWYLGVRAVIVRNTCRDGRLYEAIRHAFPNAHVFTTRQNPDVNADVTIEPWGFLVSGKVRSNPPVRHIPDVGGI